MNDELSKTPLYQEHVALGARMARFAGFEMPHEFSDSVEEHLAVRRAVGVFDACHKSAFRVFGFGAFDYLQSAVTSDVGTLAVIGDGQPSLICGEDGGIVDEAVVFHSGDLEYMIIANSVNRATAWESLHTSCPTHVELVDESDRTGLIALQGPEAGAVLRELAQSGFVPPAGFSMVEARLETVPTLVSGTGETGEIGFEIFCHVSHAVAIWRLLLSFPEVVPCGFRAYDSLRLEMGYPRAGVEIDRQTDPISARLGRRVALEKGGFVGREMIARLAKTAPKTVLVGLVSEQGVPEPGHVVLHERNEVGRVTSGMLSPTLGTGIALGYVPTELSEPGTRLGVRSGDEVFVASVEMPPFVKRTSQSAEKA